MMHIMRNSKLNARAAAKDATHERIVAVAARAIRRSGYDGTGVADIMKEAGLTHGAFYAHFTSREAMLAEAAGRACAESAAAAADAVANVPPGMALASMLAAYLSKEHLEHAESGMPPGRTGFRNVAPGARSASSGDPAYQGNDRPGRPPVAGLGAARRPPTRTRDCRHHGGRLCWLAQSMIRRLSDALREAALKHLTPAGH